MRRRYALNVINWRLHKNILHESAKRIKRKRQVKVVRVNDHFLMPLCSGWSYTKYIHHMHKISCFYTAFLSTSSFRVRKWEWSNEMHKIVTGGPSRKTRKIKVLLVTRKCIFITTFYPTIMIIKANLIYVC